MKLKEPIYIMVEGGCVTNVCNARGETIAAARLIDFDNEEHGNCPVCGEELELTGGEEVAPGMTAGGNWECQTCGYDESKENALACAVKYHDEDNKAVNEKES